MKEYSLQAACPDCEAIVFINMDIEDYEIEFHKRADEALSLLLGRTKHYSLSGKEKCENCGKMIKGDLTVSVNEKDVKI